MGEPQRNIREKVMKKGALGREVTTSTNDERSPGTKAELYPQHLTFDGGWGKRPNHNALRIEWEVTEGSKLVDYFS